MFIFFLFSLTFCQIIVPDYKTKSINVQGEATDYVETTEVVIGFAVETQEKTALLSFSKNKKITQSVQKILDSLNIPEKNISTTAFTITPQYESIQYENRTSSDKYTGVQVKYEYEVRLSDVKITSRMIDMLTRADVNIISYINFEIPEEELNRIRNNLIQRAIKDAQDRAEAMVKSLNITLGKVKSVKFENEPYYYAKQSVAYSRGGDLELAAAAAPTLYSNTNKEVNAKINIEYFIIN